MAAMETQKDKTNEADKELRNAAQIPVRLAGWHSLREFQNAILRHLIRDPKKFAKSKFEDTK